MGKAGETKPTAGKTDVKARSLAGPQLLYGPALGLPPWPRPARCKMRSLREQISSKVLRLRFWNLPEALVRVSSPPNSLTGRRISPSHSIPAPGVEDAGGRKLWGWPRMSTWIDG